MSQVPETFDILPAQVAAVGSSVWSVIDTVAEFVADLSGWAQPRFEEYIQDSLDYQASLADTDIIRVTIK